MRVGAERERVRSDEKYENLSLAAVSNPSNLYPSTHTSDPLIRSFMSLFGIVVMPHANTTQSNIV